MKQRQNIEDAVRDIVIGGGDPDITAEEVVIGLESRLGRLDQIQKDLARKIYETCLMEMNYP